MGGKTVWLVGMMGSGKSSVGRVLGERMGLPYHDTDADVEREAGASIHEIFATEGETGFRARERRAVETLAGRPAVVALGGGAFCQPAVRARVEVGGRVVYLRARPETLAARLRDAADRPLLDDHGDESRPERIEGLLAERRADYERAEVVVDTDGLGPDEVAERVVGLLQGD